MKLEVVRPPVCGPVCTIGELLLNGEHECWTLEDVVRPDGEKIYGQTAIPSGTYKVVITYSPHFQRDLPLLVDVPNFEGVRIHPGNTAADTEGCLLVGQGKTTDSVTQSRGAFNTLFPKIRDAIRNGEEVWITYRNGDEQ
jgi:Family of unknown function (DUF5675)